MIGSTTYLRFTSNHTQIPPLKPYKPISSTSFPRSSASNFNFNSNSNSNSSTKFTNSFSFINRNRMIESIKTSVSRDTSGDEHIAALEQESFIDGSSDFSPNRTVNALESTLNYLSKWFVTALFGIIILWRHDAEALWAAMGSILNAGLSVVLKQIINQERPISKLRPVSVSDPGMPSSHAQSIFFAVIFASHCVVEWLGLNGLTISLIMLLIAVGSYFSWLRVVQEFHSVNQVAVGAAVGSIFSVFWVWSWDAIMLKLFISYLWVRILIVGGSIGCCMGFILHVIRYWVIDRKE